MLADMEVDYSSSRSAAAARGLGSRTAAACLPRKFVRKGLLAGALLGAGVLGVAKAQAPPEAALGAATILDEQAPGVQSDRPAASYPWPLETSGSGVVQAMAAFKNRLDTFWVEWSAIEPLLQAGEADTRADAEVKSDAAPPTGQRLPMVERLDHPEAAAVSEEPLRREVAAQFVAGRRYIRAHEKVEQLRGETEAPGPVVAAPPAMIPSEAATSDDRAGRADPAGPGGAATIVAQPADRDTATSGMSANRSSPPAPTVKPQAPTAAKPAARSAQASNPTAQAPPTPKPAPEPQLPTAETTAAERWATRAWPGQPAFPTVREDPRRRLLLWRRAGYSSSNVSNHKIGRNLPNVGWAGFVRDDVLPQLEWGVRRVVIHNPFGIAPDEWAMSFNQYLEAEEAGLTFVTKGFVEAWRPVIRGDYTDGEPVEVIAYFGSLRHDPDFTELEEAGDLDAWNDLAWRSIAPALEAGMSIGFDSLSKAPADHPSYALARQIEAAGYLTYVESMPRVAQPHWKEHGALVLEAFYLGGVTSHRHLYIPVRDVPRGVIRLLNNHARSDYRHVADEDWFSYAIIRILSDGHQVAGTFDDFIDAGTTIDEVLRQAEAARFATYD